MGELEAYEVVASVVGATEDDAVTGFGQLCYCLLESGGFGERWGVGVDQADGAVAAGEDVLGSGQQALAEGVAALEDERRSSCGQDSVEESFVTGGGVADEPGGPGHRGDVAGWCHGESRC